MMTVSPLFPYIIFDMDGTLIDSSNLISDSYDFAVGTLPHEQSGRSRISNTPGTLEEALSKRVPAADVPQAVEKFHSYYEKNFDSNARAFPGIRTSLVALRRRGVELAVFTGQTRRATQITLQKTDLARFFAEIVTANDVGEPKPSPEGLKLAMEGIGADPDGTVYIGDDPDDVNASRRAGVKTAAALWGSLRRNELLALQPDFAFGQPAELQLLSSWTLR
jgi:pyrophosphatase PpaX